MKKLTCFKAYDIRGKLGEELNEDIAWRIGRAYGEFLKPKTIVLGGDVRLTSETLKLALAKGLQDAGVDVLDIGPAPKKSISPRSISAWMAALKLPPAITRWITTA